MAKKELTEFKTELVSLELLKPHPKNYRTHAQDQLDHIVKSIKMNGIYRPIVCADDYTILAGHGVVEACKTLKLKQIPIIKLDLKFDSVKAMKLLTGDNEISKLGIVDDRLLTDLLKDISLDVDGLLGTGFDQKQLANLLFVTRPESEIKDFNTAAEWVGLPEYQEKSDKLNKLPIIEITFKNEKDREKFVKETGLKIKSKIGGRKWATVWPFKARNDMKSIKFRNKKK